MSINFMKQEVYSCLKMLEAFNKESTEIYNLENYESASTLDTQYYHIVNILEKHLTKDHMQFIPRTYGNSVSYDASKSLILELISASAMAISFLRSLEGDLEKELRAKKEELKFKEKQLSLTQKTFDKALNVIAQIPELKRSEAVNEMKRLHREIEKNTKN